MVSLNICWGRFVWVQCESQLFLSSPCQVLYCRVPIPVLTLTYPVLYGTRSWTYTNISCTIRYHILNLHWHILCYTVPGPEPTLPYPVPYGTRSWTYTVISWSILYQVLNPHRQFLPRTSQPLGAQGKSKSYTAVSWFTPHTSKSATGMSSLMLSYSRVTQRRHGGPQRETKRDGENTNLRQEKCGIYSLSLIALNPLINPL